jgi:diguanylate cyclase (GGDEF)-like protein
MESKAPSRKISLVQKLIASYAAMAFFTTAALVFAITGLYSLNKTARDIAKRDLVLLRSANQLRQSLLAQESYAGKYAILKSPEFADLFHKRESECLVILQELELASPTPEIAHIVTIYSDYRAAVQSLFRGDPVALRRLAAISQRLIDATDAFTVKRQETLNARLEAADRKESATVKWTLIFSLTGFVLAICVAALFLFNTTTAIGKLKKAMHRIADGDFDYDPQIPPGDEIGTLAYEFSAMAKRLKALEQMNLDASPLTRLPGNIVIERVLTKRLEEGKLFAVCYGDLDNMKVYNDRYGYIKGSDVIKMAGDIILQAVQNNAEEDAFVGHIGGDDFVMVFSHENIAAVCEEVLRKFDEGIVAHYTKEDLAKGAIEGVDRYGVPRSFPIMTISVAVIICQRGEYDSASEIAKAAAEIKDYVKIKPGSNYMINQRRKAR